MIMETVNISTEFIKLGQALKLAGLVSSGVDAKMLIGDGQILVDGKVETRRGRKLFGGEVIEFEGNKIKVVNNAD